MLFFYNVVQILGLIVFAPALFVKIILTRRYRGRILKRLGIGLDRGREGKLRSGPRIWLHALSLGEVSSARSLVRQLRRDLPRAEILVSSATRSGEEFARATLAGEVDRFVPFPLDLYWSAGRVIQWAAPDIFVLVETDFWPNFLACLRRRRIPAVLVNGRISEASFTWYRLGKWVFRPLFESFARISMQTEAEARKMVRLGVEASRVCVLGNLKYDSALPAGPQQRPIAGPDIDGIPAGRIIWLAGSTHPGEEEMILQVYQRLRNDFPDLFLILAPRKAERGAEVAGIAASHGLAAIRRTAPGDPGEVFVLDTLGELASFYSICDLAFVGGSLVRERGHNPLEPAASGKPVVFGPSMEDFAEVSRDLVLAGGGAMVRNGLELGDLVHGWLADHSLRRATGRKAAAFVARHRGGAARHAEMIRQILEGGRR